MNNKSTTLVFRLLTIFIFCFAEMFATAAIAQQVGFYPASMPRPPSSSNFGFGVGDLNNDGKDDVVTINYDGAAGSRFYVPGGYYQRYQRMTLNSFTNAADGSFHAPIVLLTNLYTFQAYDWIEGGNGFFINGLVDINGDNKLDVCLDGVIPDSSELRAGTLALPTQTVCFTGNGDGSFNPTYIKMMLPVTGNTVAFSSIFADMNGDGKADYIASIPSATGFDIAIYYGNGNGGFASTPSVRTVVTSSPGSTLTNVMDIKTFDINNDGRKDILFLADNPTAAFANEQSLHAMTANATGGYQDTIFDSFHSAIATEKYSSYNAQDTLVNGTIALWIFPYNFDYRTNTPQVISSGSSKVYFSNNQGSFNRIPSLNNKYPAVFGDFNQDGIIDAVMYTGRANGINNIYVTTFQQNVGLGAGQFTDGSIFYTSYASFVSSPSLTGPYRFGAGGNLGFLMSIHDYTSSTNYVEPYTVQAGAQKMSTYTYIDFFGNFPAGQSFTVNANVLQVGQQALINGTGTFEVDGTPVGTAAIINSRATINIQIASPGIHTVSFNYDGDLLNVASQGSIQTNILPVEIVPPTFTGVSDISVKEGQVATFSATLSAATTQAASVKLTLVSGTATSGLDYSSTLKYSDDNGLTYNTLASDGIASLKAGTTAILIQVTTLTDTLVEPNETYNLYLDAVSGISTAVRGWGIGTIQDVVITPPPKFTGVSDITVREGQVATFAVTLSGPTTQVAQVKLSLVDGTAKGGLDYSTTLKYSDDNGATYKSLASGGVADIKTGAFSFLVQVATLKDERNEPSETFNLYIDSVSGLTAGRGWGIGTILDRSDR